MGKEFDVTDQVHFPRGVICHRVDGYNVLVAPDYPNWIAFNDREYDLYMLMRESTIIDSLYSYHDVHPEVSEQECIDLMTDLLARVERCQFYGAVESAAEDAIDTIPKKIHLTFTNNCNMRCPHCFVSAGKVPLHELNVSKVLDWVEKIQRVNGVTDVVVSGGEPLVHPRILELLRGLAQQNVTLFTNGTMINESNYLTISECCKEVQISFEGITEPVYESIRGKGNFRKVLHAIDLLKSTGVKLTLAITILPTTVDDIAANLIPFIKSIDCRNLEIRLNDDVEMTGNALSMDFRGYDKSKSDKVIRKIVLKLREMGIASAPGKDRNVRFSNCGIGTNIVVDADGRLYPCNKFSSYYQEFDSDIRDLFDEFDDLNVRTSVENMPKCKRCELRYICAGGCRIDNLDGTGDMLIPTCNDAFKESQYRRLLMDSIG